MIPNRLEADWQLEALHKACSYHRQAIEQSKQCGCFYCLHTFAPTAIECWLDHEMTALCPECGIDAVLPDSPDPGTLEAMHAYWFGEN